MVTSEGHNLVFVLSLPRSGSTLLSAILSGHPDVLCPPEPWLLLKLTGLFSDSYADAKYDEMLATSGFKEFIQEGLRVRFLRETALAAYNTLLQESGRKVFVDKTPRYFYILDEIAQLFPNARFIWLKRNPLDIAVSYRDTWGISIDELCGSKDTSHSFDLLVGLDNLIAFFDKNRNQPNYLELNYEALVSDPRSCLAELSAFLGLSYLESMLDFKSSHLFDKFRAASMGDRKIINTENIHTESLNKWKDKLTPDELYKLTSIIDRKILERLSYGAVAAELEALNYDLSDKSEIRNSLKERGFSLNRHLVYKIDSYKGQLQQAQQQLESSKTQLEESLNYISILQRKIDALGNLRGAVKTIIRISSVKLKLYSFLKRHESDLRRIYAFSFNFKNRLRLSKAVPPLKGPSLPINSPVVEAFSIARSIPGNLDEQVLIDFYKRGSQLRKVMAINPSEKIIQAVYMLSMGGADVVCISDADTARTLEMYGVKSIIAEASAWLRKSENEVLSQYDAFFFPVEIYDKEKDNLMHKNGAKTIYFMDTGARNTQDCEKLTGPILKYHNGIVEFA